MGQSGIFNFTHPIELKVICEEGDCHGCVDVIRFLHPEMFCRYWVALWALRNFYDSFLILKPPPHFFRGAWTKYGVCIHAAVLDATGLVATSDVCSASRFDLTWVLSAWDSNILDEWIFGSILGSSKQTLSQCCAFKRTLRIQEETRQICLVNTAAASSERLCLDTAWTTGCFISRVVWRSGFGLLCRNHSIYKVFFIVSQPRLPNNESFNKRDAQPLHAACCWRQHFDARTACVKLKYCIPKKSP